MSRADWMTITVMMLLLLALSGYGWYDYHHRIIPMEHPAMFNPGFDFKSTGNGNAKVTAFCEHGLSTWLPRADGMCYTVDGPR